MKPANKSCRSGCRFGLIFALGHHWPGTTQHERLDIMDAMHRSKTIGWAIAAIFIATATFGLLLLRKPIASNPSDLVLSFVGFTNMNQRLAAIFTYSNGTGHDVTLDIKGIEYRSNGVWQPATILPTTAAGRTLSGASLRNTTGDALFVSVQTTNTPCRLRILCVEPAIGLAGAIDKATDAGKSLAKNRKLGTFTRFEGRNYEVTASSEFAK